MNLDVIYQKISNEIDTEEILTNEPMSKHTSFKTGGNADFFIKTTDISKIKYLIKISKDENIPLTIVGNGSNLLVKDNGIRGIVLKPDLKNIDIKKVGNKIIIKSGSAVPLIKLSKIAEENSATGLEFAIRNTRFSRWSYIYECWCLWI